MSERETASAEAVSEGKFEDAEQFAQRQQQGSKRTQTVSAAPAPVTAKIEHAEVEAVAEAAVN